MQALPLTQWQEPPVLVEVPEPEPGPGEVVIQVAGAGACRFLIFGDLGPPLLATQILWINLVTDGFPVLALATDPVPPGIMAQPPRRARGLLGAREQLQMLERGAILAVAALAVLLYGHLFRDFEWEQVRTLVFTTLVGVQLGYVFVIRHEGQRPGDRLPPNWWLRLAVGLSVLLQIAVVATPAGHELFDTRSLDASDWLVTATLSALVPQWIRLLQHRPSQDPAARGCSTGPTGGSDGATDAPR